MTTEKEVLYDQISIATKAATKYLKKKKTTKKKTAVKITFDQQQKAFIDVCVAQRKYYWIYAPHSWMVKDGDSPKFLGDSLIKAHLQGKEKHGFIVCLGLSMFVDNYTVLYGALDFDVHGYTPKQRELKLKEFGGDETKLNKDEDKFKEKQRKQIKEDLPKICEELDTSKYLYYLNSSGSEGIHLRVYSNKPINARVMRYYLKDLQARIIGDSERHEVFPKQDELNEDTPYGNQMKGVIAVHPKTKKLAGIIKDGEVLDREQSLNYLVEFAKKIPKAKIISFAVTEEIRKKYEKKPIVLSESERIQTNSKGIPYYCGALEVGEENIFPRPMHDSGMDIQAFLYYQDKPKKFARWKEMQGRLDSAFNTAEKGVWLCNVQQKYYRKNKDNEVGKKCIAACMSCSHCYDLYIPDLKPLIQNLDNPEKKNRIIQDILRLKRKVNPLDIEEIIKQINEITGIDKTTLKKQLKYEKEKIEKLRAKIKPKGEEDIKVDAESLKILEDPKIFDKITITEFDKKIVKEKTTRQTIFLVANMRNVENLSEATDNLLVNAESRAGKDYIIKCVMTILPQEEVIEKKRTTPKVLAYLNNRINDPLATWNKKVLALEDTPNDVLNDDSFKVIASARGLTRQTILINQKLTDIEIDGKPPIILSSATANPKTEILGRFPICRLDESEEQTKAIIKRQLEFAKTGKNTDYNPKITEALKCLKRLKVRIPFADKLFGVISTKHVIMRTHNLRFLDYIKSSCSLHQYQRKQDEDGYYLAEGQDYNIARIALLKTTTNPFMIPITRDHEKILEIMRKLPKQKIVFSNETGNEKEVKLCYSVKDLEPRVSFMSDQMLRKELKTLTQWGFLESKNEKREDIKQKVQVWNIVEVSDKTIPKWEELKTV